MKTRGIVKSIFFPLLHPIKYIEYTLVPFLMRMIKISDGLYVSALIRGLDSDENIIKLTELRFRTTDLLIGLLGALIIDLVIVILNGCDFITIEIFNAIGIVIYMAVAFAMAITVI